MPSGFFIVAAAGAALMDMKRQGVVGFRKVYKLDADYCAGRPRVKPDRSADVPVFVVTVHYGVGGGRRAEKRGYAFAVHVKNPFGIIMRECFFFVFSDSASLSIFLTRIKNAKETRGDVAEMCAFFVSAVNTFYEQNLTVLHSDSQI